MRFLASLALALALALVPAAHAAPESTEPLAGVRIYGPVTFQYNARTDTRSVSCTEAGHGYLICLLYTSPSPRD